jgi:hypothetical protein
LIIIQRALCALAAAFCSVQRERDDVAKSSVVHSIKALRASLYYHIKKRADKFLRIASGPNCFRKEKNNKLLMQ